MLDKIKVYRRSDAKEIKSFSISFCEIDGLHLIQHETGDGPQMMCKTDPLNKFKKEMYGWWFCEGYVVIMHNRDKVEIVSYDYAQVKNWDIEKYGYSQEKRDIRYSEFIINGETIAKYLDRYKDPSKIYIEGTKYDIDSLIDQLKELKAKNENNINPSYIKTKQTIEEIINTKLEHGSTHFLTYSIGEDKYLKLLELID